MRVLLDTNILIHREAAYVARDDIGLLFNWIDRLQYTKCIHPSSVKEIQKHFDERTRIAFCRKLESYNQLRAPAPLRPDIQAVAQKYDTTPNDAIDTQLLNELAAGTVDILISEDRKIGRKAQELSIADKLFTIDAFLEKVVAENPDFVDYQVLSVRKEVFGRVNVTQPFFHSLRRDYPHFDSWFMRKTDESAYVCHEGNQLIAFMYLKVENEREPYPDIIPQMAARRRLKIGTLKVELNGFKLGERFLKIAFDNAIQQRVNEIYITIFQCSLEKERLVRLLEDFGFTKFGEKHTHGRIEDVYVRSMQSRFDARNPKLTFPFVSRKRPWYIVSIYPKYHTSLLPDSILKTESPDDFTEQEPHRNAIRKVFISRSYFRDLQIGDIIVFYRTGGYYKSVITTIGIIDAVHRGIKDEKQFIQLCRQRSVFNDEELKAQWNYTPRNRPFVVEFLYAYSFPRRPNLEILIDAEIIKDIESAPRGFEYLSNDKITRILELTETDTRFIVD